MAVSKVDLVATFEEFAGIPSDKCMTEYVGDYSLWAEKPSAKGFDEKVYEERFQKALGFLGITEDEYFNNSDFVQRGKIKEAFNLKVYEIYKEDWYKEHNIPDEDVIKLLDEWQFAKVYSDFEGSFEDYELEYGYNGGEIYACFDEFMDNEFDEFKPVLYVAPIVGEIVFHQTGEVMRYTDFDAFKRAVINELDCNTPISVFLANGMDKSWIFDNVSGIGLQEVSYKSFASFEYLSKELASLDSEKTMFEVYLDNSGEKKLHYLGYFYESDEGLKLQEYIGFEAPFSEVVNEGIYDYEMNHSEEFGGQQYITYYDGKETADAFQEINEYFVGETLTFLCKDHQFMDLPVGKYALSLHSLKELCDMHNKNNKSIDAVIRDAVAVSEQQKVDGKADVELDK